jgi:hypothetical protein
MINVEDIIESYKTDCCESDYYREGRATYKCRECDADITMTILYIYMAFESNED